MNKFCHLCRRLRATTLTATRQKINPNGITNNSVFFMTTRYRIDARDVDHHDKEKHAIVRHRQIFDEAATEERNKRTYRTAIDKYLKYQGVQRRGHVEFMYAALDKMKEFSVHRDLDVYKQIIALFPKGKMVTKNAWQKEMMHYPKQQQCLIDILDKMEANGVVPDDDLGAEIIKIFGINTYPFRKYQRMMYWMPKFKYANPYHVPYELPVDHIELAKMAIKRMSVDLENNLSVFQASDFESSMDNTFIVSGQSPSQQNLICDHPIDVPLYVEGGFQTWLRHKCLTYFVLKSKETHRYHTFMKHKEGENDEEQEDTLKFTLFEEEPTGLIPTPTIHEQEDGTILSMCITGTGSKDSLASWMKGLETANPKLALIPIVFLLRTPETGLEVFVEEKENRDVVTT